uniref:Filamin binding LIM protein 1 n=1 Tax=Salmo trutta TaxID=8032 RepID=A0A674BTQ8_SALTR
MASAAPQKRMVSSFFITLASPYRATVTQHQHTRTHSATANDMPHTAMRVGPEDSSTRKLSSAAVDRQLDQSTPSKEQLMCGFCRKPVALSETAIEALNRTYHASYFQCRLCHIPLAGKLYYNKTINNDKLLSFLQASLELCRACGEVIKDQVIRALERAYHPPCFISQGEVGEVYCLQDYYRKYATQFSACQQLIIPREDGIDSYTVECLGRSFHEDCYRCEVCSTQLSPEPNDHGCHPLDGRVLCKSCHP